MARVFFAVLFLSTALFMALALPAPQDGGDAATTAAPSVGAAPPAGGMPTNMTLFCQQYQQQCTSKSNSH